MKQMTQIHLEDIKMHTIDMPHHRIQLRKALLNAPYWQKKQANMFLSWKGGEEMKKGKLALIGLTVSIFVLAIVVSTTLVSKNTKMAYADELAHKSYEAVSMLTPEQQEELKQKVQFDNPKDLLQVAKEAQDLEVITYSQFMNQYFQQFMSGQGPQGPTIDISKLKFLQFTDKEGKRNVIGINDNNLPVIMLSLSGNSNTSEQPSSGTFRRPEGEAIPTPGPGAIRSSGSSNEDSKGTSGGKVNVEEIR